MTFKRQSNAHCLQVDIERKKMFDDDQLLVLELFSGIGGMHYALKGKFGNGANPFNRSPEVIMKICLFILHLQLVAYPVKCERQLT